MQLAEARRSQTAPQRRAVDDSVLLRELGRAVVALARRIGELETAQVQDRAEIKRLASRLAGKSGASAGQAPQRKKGGNLIHSPINPTPEELLALLPDAVLMIVEEEAWRVDVDVLDVLSRDRGRIKTLARTAAMVRTLEETGLSLSAVGRLFDRDHSTVSSAHDRHLAAKAAALAAQGETAP